MVGISWSSIKQGTVENRGWMAIEQGEQRKL